MRNLLMVIGVSQRTNRNLTHQLGYFDYAKMAVSSRGALQALEAGTARLLGENVDVHLLDEAKVATLTLPPKGQLTSRLNQIRRALAKATTLPVAAPSEAPAAPEATVSTPEATVCPIEAILAKVRAAEAKARRLKSTPISLRDDLTAITDAIEALS